MSFSAEDIAGMLSDYEHDHKTGMQIRELSGLLYDYTSGYPFLVSRLCKIMDEQLPEQKFPDKTSVWTKNGILEAVRLLLTEKNTLFDSLIGKLQEYPELKSILYSSLFCGQNITYNPDDPVIDMALMFGFLKTDGEKIAVANRIFETRLYNYFLTTTESQTSDIYKTALQNRNQQTGADIFFYI